MFIDSHCHLNFPELSARLPELLENMALNQVSHALCVSVELTSFPDILGLANAHDNLFASVGVHPDYEDTPEPSVAQLVELAQHTKVIAIGETGLDYYRLNGRSIDDMAWQRERFRTHIRAARLTGKPLIVHTRSAAEDTLRLMQEEGAHEVGGVMHCFTESLEVAEAAIAMNFHISFSGIVTFRSAADLQETARRIPLERMLVETDSPYLAPVPYRGKLNQPAYVRHVGEFLAELRGVTPEEFARQTSENFSTLFNVLQ